MFDRQQFISLINRSVIDIPDTRNAINSTGAIDYSRIEDISQLVERFALEFTRENDIPYRGFIPEAIRFMKNYNWPGNVRELRNLVERISIPVSYTHLTLPTKA